MRSDDGGQTWRWAAWSGKPLRALNRPYYSIGEGVLEVAGACIDEEGCPPLLRSVDAGKSWQWVEVPAPPAGWPQEPDLRLQPDGSLLLRGDGGWYQLERGQSSWRPAKAPG